jgi:hypothetical protein
MAKRIVSHHELEVYKKSFQVAMTIFEVSRAFPREELYSLTGRSAALRAPSMRTSVKRGANDATKPISSAN